MSKYEDFGEVRADRVAELESALADIGVRRAAIAAHSEAARAKVAEADATRLKLVSALATGAHNGPALSAAVAAKSDAEAHLAAFADSLAELDAEEKQTSEFHRRCAKARGFEVKAELHRLADAKAADLDAAGARFNAAFAMWRDSKRAAHDYAVPFAEHGYGGPAFKSAGAGWEASAALDHEIKLDLARIDFVNTAVRVAAR
jgi:hypothetical protein